MQPSWNNLKVFQGMPTGTPLKDPNMVQTVQTAQTAVQGMSCLPAFPKMDTASVKPLVLLLCFWLRYIAVSADEDEVWPHGVCAKLPLLGAHMLWFQSPSGNQERVRPLFLHVPSFKTPMVITSLWMLLGQCMAMKLKHAHCVARVFDIF